MKKYIICLFIGLFMVVSCREEAVPRPDNLLSEEKMAAILYDITLINAVKGVSRKQLNESYLRYDTYLFEKHGVDSTQFAESNNYYSANPTLYHEIYGIVRDSLTKERKIVGEKLEAEQKRRDSVQKAMKYNRKKGDTLTKKKFGEAVKGKKLKE
jgi:uncharacterized protein YcfL